MMEPFKNTAFIDFSQSEARRKMEEALKKVRSEFGRCYSFHHADPQELKSEKILNSLNPAHPDQVVGSVPLATQENALQALQIVYQGSKDWKKTKPQERSLLVEKLGNWIEQQRYELAAWMIYEVGKTWREADADVAEAIDFCHYYAREMERLARPKRTQEVLGEDNTLHYFPKGVGVVISPWNFPLAILTGMTAANLVSGNTVVIKPAGQSSVIAAKLVQGLREVGFPENSFYFLPGEGSKIGGFLVSDPRVDIITFTGSAEVGLSIIHLAAQLPKPGQRGVKKVIAEMGGKNALIIDEDADVDEALKGAVHSAFGFQGQKCSALSRLLVHEKIYDVFVPRFVEATKALRVGDPANPEHQLGPVVDAKAKQKIEQFIKSGKSRLSLLWQSSNIPTEGYYVGPCLFEVTDIQEELFQNEIFGPVICIKKISSIEEGVAVTNAVPYALTGGIYSRNPAHIEQAKRDVEVGNLYINRGITGAIVQRQPFGGFKLSGVGSKAGGPDYLLQFLEPRTITENTVRKGFAS